MVSSLVWGGGCWLLKDLALALPWEAETGGDTWLKVGVHPTITREPHKGVAVGEENHSQARHLISTLPLIEIDGWVASTAGKVPRLSKLPIQSLFWCLLLGML